MWPLFAALGAVVSAVTSWSWWRSPGARTARIADAAVGDVRAEDDRLAAAVDGPRRRLAREAARWRAREERRRLERLDVETLREAGADRVRWASLREAGVTTVADVRDRPVADLTALPGIGATTAQRLHDAAVRLDDELASARPSPPADLAADDDLDLARATLDAVDVRRAAGDVPQRLARRRAELDERLDGVRRAAGPRAWATRRLRRVDDEPAARAARRLARDAFDVVEGELGDAVRDVHARLAARRSASASSRDELADAWRRRRAEVAASLEAALAEPAAPAVDAAAGTRLPDEIVARVLGLDFDPRGLSAQLRRYQDFGARYLVVQERTLLGDDMGLGKTLQALAAMSHVRALDPDARLLAVVPATVVHGWRHEAERFTTLPTHLAHGPRRDEALAAWLAGGGLLITSYATLSTLALHERLDEGSRIAMLVADEAHYVKNPEATRTRTVAALLPRADRVCLLTGTPLENRLDEFAALLRLVRPDLPALAEFDERALGWSLDPRRFGLDVAEAYLRRNQRDVLVELPERIDADDWLDVGDAERAAYLDALAEGNVMAARRAVTIGAWRRGDPPDASTAKLRRVVELVDEARAAGRKTLVFSYFLDVLARVSLAVDAFATIRGDVGPAERQRTIDAFTASDEPLVLLGQIGAAGVGLNLQAASVVVLMEPQWKPSTEEQAIARAHRMGQPDVVLVHRLLARDGIDERIDELLDDKLELFERYVSPSAVAAACSDATEPSLARLVVDAERARLGVTPSGVE